MLQQVDLTLEASNLQKFEKAFSLWGDVSFPVPVGNLATEEVSLFLLSDGQLD
jgi:predicted unusual protein kinase regulating ubiquinone biosynthesis (AarF/ABC1/UbiB family)